MKIKFLVFFFLMLQLAKANTGKDVTIYGNALEYANMNLIVEYEANYIIRDHKGIQTFRVDKQGSFKTTFKVDEITKIYIQLGEIQGYMFVEPSKSYEIKLPEYRVLKPENKLNPFFIPEPVLLGILNGSGLALNKKIRQFEDEYNSEFAKNIKKIVLTNNRKLANSIIDKINAEFPSEKGSWFDTYKEYTYMNLRNFIYSNQVRRLINDYFTNSPIKHSLDPYWESFNQVFSNFFYSYFNSKHGEALKKIWNHTQSFNTLVVTLSKDSLFKNRSFAELVMLKGLYDGFYSGNHDKEKIISLVKKATEESKDTYNANLAKEILRKIDKLREGTLAPPFELPTLSGGRKKELKDFRGKFVYLNFANTQNYACKKDFQILSQFAEMFKRDLVVVTVLTDENVDKAYQYVKSNKFRWSFLHFGQNAKVLLDYAVKAFPTYYLIDPDGNIVFSPAPAPEENFVPMFSETYNEYRYKKLRKEKPKVRTIYDL